LFQSQQEFAARALRTLLTVRASIDSSVFIDDEWALRTLLTVRASFKTSVSGITLSPEGSRVPEAWFEDTVVTDVLRSYVLLHVGAEVSFAMK
jgi:hypothetical protein